MATHGPSHIKCETRYALIAAICKYLCYLAAP
jgi:hypothetical protein